MQTQRGAVCGRSLQCDAARYAYGHGERAEGEIRTDRRAPGGRRPTICEDLRRPPSQLVLITDARCERGLPAVDFDFGGISFFF